MSTNGSKRPDPEQLLRQVQEQEQRDRRGRLKIFLGYASGVGKSFRMLDEGRRRKERGQDVVVGGIQGRRSPDVDKLLVQLEIIPPKLVNGKPVMDVEAILRRRPSVCLVDGLAHDNPPGSPNMARWQDVETLLDHGISVLTSLNLQHIEERRDLVERIRGKRVQETVPERFLTNADEIVIVDASPEQLLERAREDSSVPLDARALSELRELALLTVADVVDRQLERYLEGHGIQQLWGTQERILVVLTPWAKMDEMLASGKRNADRFHGELLVVAVKGVPKSPAEERRIEAALERARREGAEACWLEGSDAIDAVLAYAREQGITQIFVPHSTKNSLVSRLVGSPLDRLIRGADNMDLRIFPH